MASTVSGVLLTGNHAGRPSSGVTAGTLYACSTHSLIYQTTDTGSTWGTWATLGTGTSTTTIANDTIWAAKGDIVGATGNDAAAVLSVGANDTILMADSAATNGLKWVASATPSTQALGDAAAVGTADTFTRGDHKHAMPAASSIAGYEIDYVQRTSAVNITNTGATPDTILTGNSVSYDGSTSVYVEFHADQIRPGAANGNDLNVFLYEDGSKLCYIGYILNNGSTSLSLPASMKSHKFTPSAGSHTYSIRAAVSAGTGSVSAGAGTSGGEQPAFIRIVRA